MLFVALERQKGGCETSDDVIPAPKPDGVIEYEDGPVVLGCSSSASIRLS